MQTTHKMFSMCRNIIDKKSKQKILQINIAFKSVNKKVESLGEPGNVFHIFNLDIKENI